jgi:hypothetical protein
MPRMRLPEGARLLDVVARRRWQLVGVVGSMGRRGHGAVLPLPLAIFGKENYGDGLLLGAPSRMGQALAPFLFGLLIGAYLKDRARRESVAEMASRLESSSILSME